MTVVAVLFAETLPIIVADSLISSNDPISAKPTTPLTEREQRPGVPGFLPAGTARKVWDLGNRMHFLYSGRVDHARLVMEHIWAKTYGGATRYNASLHAEVADRVRRDQLEVSFIVLSAELDDEVSHYYHGQIAQCDVPSYGKVIAIGAGAVGLIEGLLLRPGCVLPEPSASSAREHMDAALLNALNAVSLLSQDYLSTDSVMAAASSGGYFEVIHPISLYIPEKQQQLREILGDGFAHVFLEIDQGLISLRKIVLSQASGDTNFVVATRDGAQVPINAESIDVTAEQLLKLEIHEKRDDTLVLPFDGSVPFHRISHITLHGRLKYQNCPHVATARSMHVALNHSVIEIGAHPGGMRITFPEANVVDRLVARLVATPCPRCVEPV
ncbi:hypothetical protein [Rhodanobacter terrae]|uniref:Uncharacterized protein n=1 Tax=Rhodanobacter terrae TaxID=418647 RepID=A0ABW0SVN5_9GAMM